MKGVPHHLLDVASPKSVFTAYDFTQKARPLLKEIIARGKTPIICGGTGFYIDALLGRVSLPDVPPNPMLRARLAGKTAADLHALLAKNDPTRAKTIDAKNPVRLIRALEIVAELGAVPPLLKRNVDADVEWIGLKPSDEVLRKKIHARLIARMKSGMVAEGRKLHRGGLSYKRMEEFGLEYRFLARLLRGEMTRDEMMTALEAEIWQFAKRQMTYWRRNKDIRWITYAD